MTTHLQNHSAPIPRYWHGWRPLRTHLTNGLNLVFPASARFAARALTLGADQITDPALLRRVRAVRAWAVQEGTDSAGLITLLEGQGYDTQAFLGRYESLAFTHGEPLLWPVMRLSVVAGLSHLAAHLGRRVIDEGALEGAHPALQTLIASRAAVLIEHETTARDLLAQLNPGTLLRVAGMVIAAASLTLFWTLATLELLRQDRARGFSAEASPGYLDSLGSYHREVVASGLLFGLVKAFFAYLKPTGGPRGRGDLGHQGASLWPAHIHPWQSTSGHRRVWPLWGQHPTGANPTVLGG